MKDLQFTLIVLGAGAILGVLVHGLWTIRKNAEPDDYEADSTFADNEDMSFNATDDDQSRRVNSYFDSDENSGPDDTNADDSDPLEAFDAIEQEDNGTNQSSSTQAVNQSDNAVSTRTEQPDELTVINQDPESSTQIKEEIGTHNNQADSDAHFDELGIGRVRTVSTASQDAMPSKPSVLEESKQDKRASELPTPPRSFLKASESETPNEGTSVASKSEASIGTQEDLQDSVSVEQEENMSAIADDTGLSFSAIDPDEREESNSKSEVIAPEGDTAPTDGKSVKAVKRDKSAVRKPKRTRRSKVDEDQMSINFDDVPAAEEVTPNKNVATLEPEILTLHVKTDNEDGIEGARLLPLLLTLGLKFGEHQIFHRHEYSDGKGPVLFSLANMFMPGVFDIDNMEQFSTQGIAIFMTLPAEGDARQIFNMMHNGARKIAEEFNGQVLDGQRSTLTKHGVQRYYERIKEFNRKQRIIR